MDGTSSNGNVKRFHNVNVEIDTPRRVYFGEKWVVVFPKAFRASTARLTTQQHAVLWAMIELVMSHNRVYAQHTTLAAMCGITANAVSKAIGVLRREGLVLKHHNYVHELDPELVWFGKWADRVIPPRNPTPMTHDFVRVYDGGSYITTLHFPKVLTYGQYEKRYGRLSGRLG